MLGVVSEMRIIKYLQATQQWDTGEHKKATTASYPFCQVTSYDCRVAHGRLIQI